MIVELNSSHRNRHGVPDLANHFCKRDRMIRLGIKRYFLCTKFFSNYLRVGSKLDRCYSIYLYASSFVTTQNTRLSEGPEMQQNWIFFDRQFYSLTASITLNFKVLRLRLSFMLGA